jgi:uncharacterized protein YuzE
MKSAPMKLNYFPDTDSLYIDLAHKPSVESREVSEGVVLDYDGEWSDWGERHGRKSHEGSGRAMREAAEIQGNLVGIDIDHASRKLDLRELVTTHIPLETPAKA